jgi:hypothetical protein
MIFPVIVKFSEENNYDFILSAHQNHYPDLTFIHRETKEKIAVDLKSAYRLNNNRVNGMTLGAFTGYFRNRKSSKNITFPYDEYSKHYILGVIYTPVEDNIDERKIYQLSDLHTISSVVKDFDFFLNEKWKIASDKPGSGNTKNIGSTKLIKELKTGNGTFAKHPDGLSLFEDYWKNYLTNEMAKALTLEKPYYLSLKQYLKNKEDKNG